MAAYRLRLLFDENVSTSVARALICLGKGVAYVGGQQQVPCGSSDLVVAQSAQQQKRVLVTYNYDMVLAACNVKTRFIWFDLRRRHATTMETAFIFLRQWDDWQEQLSEPSVECLKVGRESIERLTMEQARKRALRRFRRTTRVRKAANERANPSPLQQGELLFEDDE